MAAADLLVVAEDEGADLAGWTAPAWAASYSPDRFWLLAHTADAAQMTALLRTFLPAAAKEFNERTPAEKAMLDVWYGRCHWYMALRRVGYAPPPAAAGEPEAKKARVG